MEFSWETPPNIVATIDMQTAIGGCLMDMRINKTFQTKILPSNKNVLIRIIYYEKIHGNLGEEPIARTQIWSTDLKEKKKKKKKSNKIIKIRNHTTIKSIIEKIRIPVTQ